MGHVAVHASCSTDGCSRCIVHRYNVEFIAVSEYWTTTDPKLVVAAMRAVAALTHFPPGLLPLIASFLGADSILVVGGILCQTMVATSVCYSLTSNSWRTDVPSMRTAQRGSPAAVAIGGRMMVFGGYDAGGQSLASCESFDPTTNEWSALPRMSTPRHQACAVEWKGRIFVFGGWRCNTGPLSSAECFDPMLNRWFAIEPMSTARFCAAAVAVPDRGILVMGGHNTVYLQSAELYDPATNRWTMMNWNLPKRLRSFAAHCIDGVLHIFGGFNLDDGAISQCWSMNLGEATLTWSPLPSLPIPLDSVASVSI